MLVVKIGGSQGINLDVILKDLAKQKRFVLVHGASHELNTISKRLGKPPRMVTSVSGFTSRYTDRETLNMFEMVYCGSANKRIVEKLQVLGVNAIGLSGLDGRLVVGKRKPFVKVIEDGKKKILRDDYTGKVEKVNVDLIKLLLKNGYVLIISPLAISYNNEAINVDGDRMAALISAALKADTLIILSNVPGLLRDKDHEKSLIKKIDKKEIDNYMKYAQGRMKKKLLGVKEALDGGVKRVILADARIESPITNALNNRGTVIK